jgi:hypothetical protein
MYTCTSQSARPSVPRPEPLVEHDELATRVYSMSQARSASCNRPTPGLPSEKKREVQAFCGVGTGRERRGMTGRGTAGRWNAMNGAGARVHPREAGGRAGGPLSTPAALLVHLCSGLR